MEFDIKILAILTLGFIVVGWVSIDNMELRHKTDILSREITSYHIEMGKLQSENESLRDFAINVIKPIQKAVTQK